MSGPEADAWAPVPALLLLSGVPDLQPVKSLIEPQSSYLQNGDSSRSIA